MADWASNLDRYPTDQMLRRHGYQIAGRPAGSEPTWWPPKVFEEGSPVQPRPIPQSEAVERAVGLAGQA